MDLMQIGVFLVAAALYVLVLPGRFRAWGLLIGSLLAMYWLQPTLPIRQLDFALPSATIFISIAGWYLTRGRAAESDQPKAPTRQDAITLLISVGVILLLTLPRYFDLPDVLELTSRPPDTWFVAIWLLLAGGIGYTLWRLLKAGNRALSLALIAIIAVFIVIKTEALAQWLAVLLRGQVGQNTDLASALDIEWLGFSYVAFRLIHTLRDRQSGRLPDLSLRDYLTYIIFFPAFTAGPIDRAERFIEDFHQLAEMRGLDPQRITEGGTRIAVGLFKKFIIADSLALISLDSIRAAQAESVGALWLLLYAYAFRLFFDFSGYSDIAIGIGILFGIKLPENFDRPYLKNNIAAFWQSWHMTLSNWVRFYVYSPLSRVLLRRKPKPSTEMIMFICHMSTMIVIGLWHGVTFPFFIWGAWHGVGLFAHQIWSRQTGKWYRGLNEKPGQKRAWTIAGVLLTFHFVLLGWVWFALPDIETAATVFVRLFGIGW